MSATMTTSMGRHHQALVSTIHRILTTREGLVPAGPSASLEDGLQSTQTTDLLMGTYEHPSTHRRFEVSCLALGMVMVLSILPEGESVASSAQIADVESEDKLANTVHNLLSPPVPSTSAPSTHGRSAGSASIHDGHPDVRLRPPSSQGPTSRIPPYYPPFGDLGSGDLDPLRASSGGGMIAGPEIFRPGRGLGPEPEFPGGPNVIIPGSIPPGARFDPIYPGGDPSVDPSAQRQRIGPDNDEFQPPGFPDMF